MTLWQTLLLVTLHLVLASATHVASDEAPTTDDSPGGGWHAIELTKEDVTRLTTTLKSEFNYRATVKYRVCMFTFDKIYKQKFAHGANYQYHGLACRVESVAGAGQCQGQVEAYPLCAIHDIRIFEPLGSVMATQVLMIDVLDGKPPKDVNNVIILTESYSGMPAIPMPSTTVITSPSPPANAPSTSGSLASVEPMAKSPSASSTTVEQSPPPSLVPVQVSSAISAAAMTMLTTVSSCLAIYLAL